MTTIHAKIDEFLAADLHGELSDAERSALHAHLVECTECRQAFQEEKNMHKILNQTLAEKKADPGFEQRMVSRFRDRVPERKGFGRLIMNLIRLRAVQLTAAAALLLTLVQMGRMITGERASSSPFGSSYAAMNSAELGQARTKSDLERDATPAKLAESHRLPTDKLAAASGNPGLSGGSMTQNAPAFARPMEKTKAEFKDERAMAKKENPAAPSSRPDSASEAAATFGQEPPTSPATTAAGPLANRKLVRNATAELEVVSFEEAVQKITGFASEEKGYVATSSSEKQENGKLRGQIVVKVLPDSLDRFLQKLRGLGELKNQAITTEDVTKQYFDTESRLKNARLMEQRLIEILKTKSKDVSDLLEVEKELGRVREEIEQMQGELKFMDSQVQFATVTIQLAEKNMNIPAAFLLKERAQLALYATEVEKIYNDIKALASPKVQITNAQINRDSTGRVSARLSMLIAPQESDAVISRVKGMARVENFQVQTERVAQGGSGLAENAKTERDKVELNITLSRDEQEQALQQTTLRIRTADVNDKTKQLRAIAEQQNGRIRSSSFARDPNGREFANVALRVPMKNYNGLMQSLNALGKVENVSIRRDERPDSPVAEADAPADVSIQVYSQGNIVAEETGIVTTLRRTIGQGAAALMWSARMIGVALAFVAPWALALVGVAWVVRRITRARREPKLRTDGEGGAS